VRTLEEFAYHLRLGLLLLLLLLQVLKHPLVVHLGLGRGVNHFSTEAALYELCAFILMLDRLGRSELGLTENHFALACDGRAWRKLLLLVHRHYLFIF
jgi:hypothetical protein